MRVFNDQVNNRPLINNPRRLGIKTFVQLSYYNKMVGREHSMLNLYQILGARGEYLKLNLEWANTYKEMQMYQCECPRFLDELSIPPGTRFPSNIPTRSRLFAFLNENNESNNN